MNSVNRYSPTLTSDHTALTLINTSGRRAHLSASEPLSTSPRRTGWPTDPTKPWQLAGLRPASRPRWPPRGGPTGSLWAPAWWGIQKELTWSDCRYRKPAGTSKDDKCFRRHEPENGWVLKFHSTKNSSLRPLKVGRDAEVERTSQPQFCSKPTRRHRATHADIWWRLGARKLHHVAPDVSRPVPGGWRYII